MGRVQGCHSVLGWGEMFIHSHCMCAIVGVCIINHFLIASPPYPSPSIPFPTHPLSSPLFHIFHLQLSQGVRASQPLHSAALHQQWWTGPLPAHQHANTAQGGGCGEDKARRQAAGWGEAHDDESHFCVYVSAPANVALLSWIQQNLDSCYLHSSSLRPPPIVPSIFSLLLLLLPSLLTHLLVIIFRLLSLPCTSLLALYLRVQTPSPQR